MKFLLPLFLIIFAPCIGSAQTPRLDDITYRQSFSTVAFSLKKIHAKYPWMLIAGCPNREPIERTSEEKEHLAKYIDSVDHLRRDVDIYSSSIYTMRRQVEYFECMLANYNNKNRDSICNEKVRNFNYPPSVQSIAFESLLDSLKESMQYRTSYFISYVYKSSDTLTLPSDAFLYKIKARGNWCPPEWCTSFYLIFRNHQVELLQHSTMVDFFGTNDPFKAYLFLAYYKGEYPVNGTQLKFKKEGNKIYFIQVLKLYNNPDGNYECLVSVDEKGEVEILERKKVGRVGGDL